MAWFHNHYRHKKCRTSWSDEWSCMVDDECPKCGADISPHESDDLSVIVSKDEGEYPFDVSLSPHDAGDSPEYILVDSFKTEAEAEAFRKKVEQLLAWGFMIGKRNPKINTDFPGAYMVAEEHTESDLPTRDASNGPQCIVGDDLAALVAEAYTQWEPAYSVGG